MNVVIDFIINGLVVVACAYLFKSICAYRLGDAIVVAIVLSVVNIAVRPILLVFSLPTTALVLGGAIFILDTLVIMIIDAIKKKFTVKNFWWAILLGLILGVTNALLSWIFTI